MNAIWLIMIAASMLYGLCTGKVDMLNGVLLNIGKETFDFVLPLLCMTCFWNGILNIAKEAGLLKKLEHLFHPFLKFLFKDIRDDEETLGYIATNITVNMFGLGSAATPMGLKAMEGMQKHNPQPDTATRSMVTFLVLNTAGVTLLSTTIIAMRTSFHSLDAVGFMPYAVAATVFASAVGLLVDRWWNYRD
ncbi:MAG: spore maturation protein A [Erysipelotrichaceae bacterium]|jgi:spore maturation protein A|nr:spore maturation protein A [Erysipelotrichaceae bacterium]